MDKEMKKLGDHGCPKDQGLVEEEMWIFSSYFFWHKSIFQSTKRRAKLIGKWIMHQLML